MLAEKIVHEIHSRVYANSGSISQKNPMLGRKRSPMWSWSADTCSHVPCAQNVHVNLHLGNRTTFSNFRIPPIKVLCWGIDEASIRLKYSHGTQHHGTMTDLDTLELFFIMTLRNPLIVFWLEWKWCGISMNDLHWHSKKCTEVFLIGNENDVGSPWTINFTLTS